jgi:hypothetical protein
MINSCNSLVSDYEAEKQTISCQTSQFLSAMQRIGPKKQGSTDEKDQVLSSK